MFKYVIINIIIIIIDILILIRTIRNISAFFISHYSVNTLFATPTLQKEFSVIEKCLIKVFDVNFYLN